VNSGADGLAMAEAVWMKSKIDATKKIRRKEQLFLVAVIIMV
jgi:hypothetical protein